MEKVTTLAHEIIELVEKSDLSVLEKTAAFKIAEEMLSLHRAQEIVNRYPNSASALADASSLLGSR